MRDGRVYKKAGGVRSDEASIFGSDQEGIARNAVEEPGFVPYFGQFTLLLRSAISAGGACINLFQSCFRLPKTFTIWNDIIKRSLTLCYAGSEFGLGQTLFSLAVSTQASRILEVGRYKGPPSSMTLTVKSKHELIYERLFNPSSLLGAVPTRIWLGRASATQTTARHELSSF